MATSGRLSFTVRSLLNLPEQDAQHRPRREPQPRAPRADPCAAWLESEPGHYPSSDESSLETIPTESSQRASSRPASPGSDAEKRKKRRVLFSKAQTLELERRFRQQRVGWCGSSLTRKLKGGSELLELDSALGRPVELDEEPTLLGRS
ncbi:Homeobox protein Nkx-2.8 [Fukomys damarensis]|uniref:Homeobox protein Nkx-2.8 n=1 Tax=Fukomys damarensis TaxID=885580 RepID=A0A091DHN5_FUKDA|nr:Homeobox protein Nkx-2.8 [Fukomys damarensis]